MSEHRRARRRGREERERIVLDWPSPWDRVRWKLAAQVKSARIVEAAAKLVDVLENAEDVPPEVLEAVRAQRGLARPDVALPPRTKSIEAAFRACLAEPE